MKKAIFVFVGLIFTNSLIAQFPCGDTLIDVRDGQKYITVLIGSQCWMAKNLNVGITINSIIPQTNNDTLEKYCYDDINVNCDTLGGLYQWDEMMQYDTTESVQGVCPSGWHIPSDTEWKNLEMALGMNQFSVDGIGFRGTDQGIQLKLGGSSGFEAILAGYYDTGPFASKDFLANFWTSTQDTTTLWTAWERFLTLNEDRVYRGPANHGKNCGYSVRCLSDTFIVGYPEIIPSINIRVFPNPTTTSFTISGNYKLPVVLEMYNIIGERVKSEKLSKPSAVIDVSSLAKGMYVWSIGEARGKLVIE